MAKSDNHVQGLLIMNTKAPVLTFDPNAKAAYFKLRDGAVYKTKKVAGNIFVDYSRGGKVLGVEMLYPRTITIHVIQKVSRQIKEPMLMNINPAALGRVIACKR